MAKWIELNNVELIDLDMVYNIKKNNWTYNGKICTIM